MGFETSLVGRKITRNHFLDRNFRFLVLIVIISLFVLFFAAINPVFLRLNNVMNMVRQTAVLAILAIGMTCVILTGGIDLSVGSNIAFAGAVAALIIIATGSPWLGLVSALGAAGAVGLINGLMVGFYRISPFMATLATMSLARGLALWLTNASAVKVADPIFNWLGQASFGPVPVVLFFLIIFYLVGDAVLGKTVFGRQLYAVGGNANAARASGVYVERQIMLVYLLCGILTGVGAVFTVGRLTSAQPWAGLGLEFEVITAVVLGGTSLSGGIGNLKGTLLGAVLVAVLGNGLGLTEVSPQIQYIIKGIMILLAVGVDEVTQRVQSKQRPMRSEQAKNLGSWIRGGQETSRRTHVLELIGISKSFPGVRALDKVDFCIKSGRVHALVGENGAGKSTLMKILAGVYKRDEGEIRIDGRPVELNTPQEAQKLGIAVIHQEFSLIPELTVAQNIFLGKELSGRNRILVDARAMDARAREVLQQLNLDIDVNKRIADLTVGQQQMVEIAKALVANAWVIVMDEPTSALSENDRERLFSIIRSLKQQNVAVVYISHRMPEIFEIADEVTVLRDGQRVETRPIAEVDEKQIVKWMVGRELGDIFRRQKAPKGKVVLEVRNLTRKGAFENISFCLHEGEVLGLSGLMGAGRTEVARCIFGLDKFDSGEILIDGRPAKISSPRDAIRLGIGFVPEDRRRDGFVPLMSVLANLSLPSLPWINTKGWINRIQERGIAEKYISLLRIRTPSPEYQTSHLSGGNQQKICLGKWLALSPRVLILDEPTRGIDVGAKAEVHKIIEMLAMNHIGILMISSELPEILGVSDRIIVLHEGHMTGVFDAEKTSQEEIMLSATGTVCA